MMLLTFSVFFGGWGGLISLWYKNKATSFEFMIGVWTYFEGPYFDHLKILLQKLSFENAGGYCTGAKTAKSCLIGHNLWLP